MTIKTYVVTEIEPIPHLFAYIDNSKTRTAAAALQTSGLNGVSPTIVKVIKIGEEVRLGVYDPTGIDRLPRVTPAETLKIADRYPNALLASRAAYTDWAGVVKFLLRTRRALLLIWAFGLLIWMNSSRRRMISMATTNCFPIFPVTASITDLALVVILRKALQVGKREADLGSVIIS